MPTDTSTFVGVLEVGGQVECEFFLTPCITILVYEINTLNDYCFAIVRFVFTATYKATIAHVLG